MGRVRFDSGSFQEDSKAGSVEEYEMRADLTTEIKKKPALIVRKS